MDLVINTSYTRPQIAINWPKMQISQKVGQFNYDYIGPEMIIDQKASLLELGMEDPFSFSARNSAESKQLVYDHIGRVAREGDRLANEIPNPDTIIQIAKEKMYSEIPEINVDVQPKTPPKITSNYKIEAQWLPGGAELDVDINAPTIEWIEGAVDITYIKGSKIDIKG